MHSDPILAICSTGELFGGVERHLLGMCSWLLRQGRTPLLILFKDAELAHQARLLGVEPIILQTRGSIDFGGPRRIAEILSEHGVNLVHAHGYRAVVNCALARSRYRFALVRTVHGLVEPSDGISSAWLKGKFYTWLERFWGRRVGSTITYVTEDLREKHSHIDHGLRTVTIFNGIDPLAVDDFTRPPEFEDGVFQIVAVGRLSRVKGLSYALQAMVGLGSNPPARLNIIGTGPLEQALHEQVEEENLADRVRFFGFRKNIYDFIAHADALVMPSLHEGAPYTVLEAMSLGVPIVASRIGGLPELLGDKQSGVLVEVGNVDELIGALNALMEDRELCRRMGEAGRAQQVRRFSLDVMGETYWDLYCEVLAKNGS